MSCLVIENYKMNTPCCIYNGVFNPSCHIYPKHGKWSFKDMYDILLDCEADEDLKGAKPLDISEGGFQWNGTNESRDLWHRTTCERNSPREHCTMDRQIRTYNVDCFCLYEYNQVTNWIEELPKHTKFDLSMPIGKHNVYSLQVPYINLMCKGNPSFLMFIKLVKLFVKHGHTIISTKGFSLDTHTGVVRRCNGKKCIRVGELRNIMRTDGLI